MAAAAALVAVSASLPFSSSSSSSIDIFRRCKSKWEARGAAATICCLYKSRHTLFFPASLLILNNKSYKYDTHKRENKSSSINSISEEGESALTTAATEVGSPSPRGLVFDVGPVVDSWDSGEVGSPVINRYLSDEGERWFMWYHGGGSHASTSTSIGLAVSKNGVHWERGAGPVTSTDLDVGRVMHPNDEDWWAFDTHSLKPSDVILMSNSPKLLRAPSVYFLYYTGFTKENLNLPIDSDSSSANFKSLPGLAISQDGRHWARIEGDHHTGALFDWEGTSHLNIGGPKVVYHSRGDLRMYYHSRDPNREDYAIGMARSTDGIKWVKMGKVMDAGASGSFDEGGVKNGHVVRVRDGGSYLMAYEGVSADGVSSIGLAVSEDGLKEWRRYGDGPVLESEEDGWDSGGVGAPYLVQMNVNANANANGDGGGDEYWRLYYRGVGRNGRTGIGLAVSKGSHELIRFERWRAFRF